MKILNKSILLVVAFVGGTAFGNKTEKFADMDKNGDGRVTGAESESAANEKFMKADADQDGQLTKGELTVFMIEQKGKDAPKAGKKSDKKVAMYDKDQNEILTREEFMSGSKEMFSKKDADGDGAVSKEEMDSKQQ